MQTDLAYRVYVTDSLYYQGQGKCLSTRYIDILNPAPVDKRSGEEIAADLIQRLGLKEDECI